MFSLCLRCIHAFCQVFGTGRGEGVTGVGGVCAVNMCGSLSWKGTKKKKRLQEVTTTTANSKIRVETPRRQASPSSLDARRLLQQRFENHTTARSSSSGSTSGHGNKQKSCLMCIKPKRTDLKCLARARGLLSLVGPALLRGKQPSHSQDAVFDQIVSHHFYDPSVCERNRQRDIWAAAAEIRTKTSTMCPPPLICSFQATVSTHNNRPHVTTRGAVWLH